MPKTKISEYSVTNSSNTDIEGINIDEGCAPSGINNAIRELMVHLKEFQTGASGDAFTFAGGVLISGTANTITGNVLMSGTNTITGSTTATFAAGAVGTPSIAAHGDTNTGIFFPAADTIAFAEGGAEAMRIDSSGNVGIGTTATSGYGKVNIDGDLYFGGTAGASYKVWNRQGGSLIFGTNDTERMRIDSSGNVGIGTSSPVANNKLTIDNGANAYGLIIQNTGGNDAGFQLRPNGTTQFYFTSNTDGNVSMESNGATVFRTNSAERARITSAGYFCIGTTPGAFFGSTVHMPVVGNSAGEFVAGFRNAGNNTNRLGINIAAGTDDSSGTSTMITFSDGDGNGVGSITNAGGTVSYNAFLGSHYTEVQGETVALLGTVYESVDALVENQYSSQDRLPKVKISDTVESTSVYGVYLGDSDWNTEAKGPTGILVAAVGAGWVRIAQGVTVQKGDLLVSNGDGCAKVQSDDIVRSKTIGKVVSTTVVDTYPDGSYLVPVVLYCG